jgi:hypothetical protein
MYDALFDRALFDRALLDRTSEQHLLPIVNYMAHPRVVVAQGGR